MTRSHGALLMGLGLAAAVVYLYGLFADLSTLRLISKPIPVLCLAAWLAPFPDADHRRIALALAFSALGDLLLEFQPPFFVPGLVAFLGAQLIFVLAFTARDRQPHWLRAIPAALFGIGASWGGYESLALPTTGFITRTATSADLGGQTMRIHIGLEDVGDLIADLEQGLATLPR